MKLILISAFVVIVVLFLIKKISKETNKELPYFKKKTLLNEIEQVLFLRLVEAMPDDYVLAQVRLADIVGIKKTSNWQRWFNKISRKSVDFVICNKSFVVLACIELDGRTHEQASRQNADKDKDEALNTASIPIIRIKAGRLPSVIEIKTMLENQLHRMPHKIQE